LFASWLALLFGFVPMVSSIAYVITQALLLMCSVSLLFHPPVCAQGFFTRMVLPRLSPRCYQRLLYDCKE
jgi:hypothetical protein